MLKIGGATVNQTPMDWANNTDNILKAIDAARNANIAILCFPELCITGYGCEDWFLSEWLAERAWNELMVIKEQCQNITIAVGLPVRIDGITYNGCCVIHNQKILGITLKQNLANDGVHYEPRWFKAWVPDHTQLLKKGNDTIQVGDLVYDVHGIRFGFEICEDGWRGKDRPGYRLHQRQVNLILNPSASHFAMGKSLLRENEVVNAGSRLFNCAYVFVNLSGNEAGRMIYDGDIIISQQGKNLVTHPRLSFKPFNLAACLIDFRDPSNSEKFSPADNKDKKEELARAVAVALFDYLRKSKSGGYVLSLSGGADSAACAIMVSEMVRRASDELGWESFCEALGIPLVSSREAAMALVLTCAYQSTVNSSDTTFQAAKTLSESLGATFYSWSIDNAVSGYTTSLEKVLGRTLTWETDDITLQNIQARSRSPIIWMLANIKRAVLLTTSNRSEGDVGYATMDGDTSGSLAPIAGLSKVFILEWLRWAETELGYSGLQQVNNLQPTAELRPLERHQTDEKDLMPYAVLAQIEYHAILNKRSPVEVFQHMKTVAPATELKGYIKKFFRMWAANQWKRERLAPSFHLDELNVDPRTWCRFPILSSAFAAELAELDQA